MHVARLAIARGVQAICIDRVEQLYCIYIRDVAQRLLMITGRARSVKA